MDNERSDTRGPATEDSLKSLLKRAISVENEDEYDKIVDDVCLIIDKGKDFSAEIRANTAGPQPKPDLHSVLCSDSFSFRLLTVSGELSLVPINPKEGYPSPEPSFDPYFESDVDMDDSQTPPRKSSSKNLC